MNSEIQLKLKGIIVQNAKWSFLLRNFQILFLNFCHSEMFTAQTCTCVSVYDIISVAQN